MLPHIKGAKVSNLPDEFPIDEVLVYYDGPRLMLQGCEDGQLYLAWWHDDDGAVERWIYLPVSVERLRAILSGKMTDRYAMDNPEDGYILVVDVDWDNDAAMRTVKTTTAALPQDALPHPDVRLDIPMPDGICESSDSEVVRVSDLDAAEVKPA